MAGPGSRRFGILSPATRFSVMMPSMSENHPLDDLKAPGRAGSASSLLPPGGGSFPQVDDHLVEPEVTRDEIIAGRRTVALPAEPPRADKLADLHYVVRSHVAHGYCMAAGLLTRFGEDSDFGSNGCVYKDGLDPATGTRFLEEVVFQVVSEENARDVSEKVPVMQRRGVRRIFAIFVVGELQVCEWCPESQSWRTLDRDSQIEDPCLVVPLPVAALLDDAVADDAVIEALAAKGNPELERLEAAVRARVQVKREVEIILKVLKARGVAVSEAQRLEILRCHDLGRLDRWLARAAVASSVNEVTSEP